MNQQHQEINVHDILHHHMQEKVSDPDFLIHMIKIFWPTFIEKDNFIFLKENYSDEYFDFCMELKSSPELWINLFLVDHFFSDMPEWEEKSITFRKAIEQMWKAKLKIDFPEKRFTIRLLHDEESGEYGITFFQTKDRMY